MYLLDFYPRPQKAGPKQKTLGVPPRGEEKSLVYGMAEAAELAMVTWAMWQDNSE